VLLPLGTDPLDEQPLHAEHAVLEQDLELARILHAQARFHDRAHHRHQDDDEHRHDDVGRNHFGPRHVEAERSEERGHRLAEDRVDGLDDPERLFFHSDEVYGFFPGRPAADFFNATPIASSAAAAMTDDAPAINPKGGRRKRAIITYA